LFTVDRKHAICQHEFLVMILVVLTEVLTSSLE